MNNVRTSNVENLPMRLEEEFQSQKEDFKARKYPEEQFDNHNDKNVDFIVLCFPCANIRQ